MLLLKHSVACYNAPYLISSPSSVQVLGGPRDGCVSMAKDDHDEASGAPERQVGRASSRSRHAQQRQTEGRRVRPGISDAQQAQQTDVFIQPNRHYVVREPRGREHVFAADGTHITSIDHSRRAHQRLVKLGKRAPVTLAQFQQFKELFQ